MRRPAGGMVEHDEVTVRLQSDAPQMIGAGQTCLSGAYHDHIHFACFAGPRVVHASTNCAGVRDLPGQRPPAISSGAPPGADAGRPFAAGTPSSGEAGTVDSSPRAASSGVTPSPNQYASSRCG